MPKMDDDKVKALARQYIRYKCLKCNSLVNEVTPVMKICTCVNGFKPETCGRDFSPPGGLGQGVLL